MADDNTSISRRYEDACYAYTIGEFAEAAAQYAELVGLGHIPSAVGLGELYLRGEGVPYNLEKGLELLCQAAAKGHSAAAFNLGALHRTGGYGVPVNPGASKHYFLLAKELGCNLPVDDYIK